ncbi:MAG: hypothetical protein HUU35_19560 [Armatimonadetes bacterium]|nr:hypothetical protein [Armatimonadota bacterium]
MIVCRGWRPWLGATLWGLAGLVFCLVLLVVQVTLNGYELLLPHLLAITVGAVVDIAVGVAAGLLVARLWARRDELVELGGWLQPAPARAGAGR